MKKLMTMLAAVATAFGLYAADEGFISGAGFDTSDTEGYTWLYDTGSSTGDFVAGYWTGTEKTSIVEEKYTYSGTHPAQFDDDPNRQYDQYLKIDSGTALVSQSILSGGAVQEIDADKGLYFDGLVQFTSFEDDMPAVDDTAKIAMFPMVDDSEAETPVSHLIIKAYGTATNLWTTTQKIDDAWHRVTIKMINNIKKAGTPQAGFVIYIDGNETPVSFDTTKVEGGAFTDAELTPEAAYFNKMGALFGSLVEDTAEVTEVAFGGKGAIDEIAFTETAPTFAGSPKFAYLTGADNIASFNYSTETWRDGEDPLVVMLPIGEETGTAHVTGITAVDGCFVEATEADVDVTAGETSKVGKAKELGATVKIEGLDDQYFENAAAALDVLNKAGEVTAKLVLNAETSDAITIDNADLTLTLDLAGNEIKAVAAEEEGDADAITVTAGALTIIDSVSEYAGKVTAAGEGCSVNCDGGVAAITAGTYNGVLMLADGCAITGGRFSVVDDLENYIPGDAEFKLDGEGYYILQTITDFTVTVPNAEPNTKLAVAINGESVGTEGGEYKVGKDSTLTAVYTADEGYELDGEGEFEISYENKDDEITAPTAIPYVVSVAFDKENTTKYVEEDLATALAAIQAAQAQGKKDILVTCLADELTIENEGRKLVLVKDQLVNCAMPGAWYISGTMKYSGPIEGSVIADEIEIIGGGTIALGVNACVKVDPGTKLTKESFIAPTNYEVVKTENEDFVQFTVAAIVATVAANGASEATPFFDADDALAEVQELEKNSEHFPITVTAVQALTLTVDPQSISLAAGETIEITADSWKFDAFAGNVVLAPGKTIKAKSIADGAKINTIPGYKVVKSAEAEDGYYTWSVEEITYVAQVGDDKFETLAEAFATVDDNQTITLLAAVDESVLYEGAKTFTIDLHGQTWTWNGGQTGNWAALKVFGGNADITIVDGDEGGKMYAAGNGFCIWAKTGTVTISSGKFYNNSNDDYAIYVNGTAAVVINGGEFRNEKDAPYIWKGDLAKLNLNVENNNPNATITVYGGTFSAEPKDDSGVKFVADGYKAVKDAEFEIWSVQEITYVAKIGDDQFETFEEAVAALTADGQTITLIDNATLTDKVTPAFSTTFDMGGFTLTAKLQKAITCSAGKTLNVTNGTIAIADGSHTIEVYGTLNVLNGARIEKDKVSGPVFDVYDAATINIEDGAYLSNGGAGQTFRFKDEFDTSNCTYTVNVKGGTIDGTGANLFDVYKPGATADITISGGTINASTALLRVGTDKDKATVNLTISGGTINATSKNFDVSNDESKLNLTLNGDCKAKFKVDQGLNDYCAEGFKAFKAEGADWYTIVATQLYVANLFVDGQSAPQIELGTDGQKFAKGEKVVATKPGVIDDTVEPDFAKGKTYYVEKLVLFGDPDKVCEFEYDGTTLTKKGDDGIGVDLQGNILTYTVETGDLNPFGAVYVKEYSAQPPVEPVDPGEEKTYNTPDEAKDAADAINKNKDTMINVPEVAKATKEAYLALVAAKVVDGTKVVVDLTADAEGTFKAELDTEIKKAEVAAALTDATADEVTIKTVAGFYYWIEGGVEVGTIKTPGLAEIGDGSTITLGKPELEATTKAFYKLAVGVMDPACKPKE